MSSHCSFVPVCARATVNTVNYLRADGGVKRSAGKKLPGEFQSTFDLLLFRVDNESGHGVSGISRFVLKSAVPSEATLVFRTMLSRRDLLRVSLGSRSYLPLPRYEDESLFVVVSRQ